MTTSTETPLAMLGHFTGSECWYRHPLNPALTFTDGVRYVAEEGGAFWLLDEIALAQLFEAKVKPEPFQVWKLVVVDSKGVLSCEDGNGGVAYTKDISFTDFPLPEIKFFLTNSVLMLPSEY